MAFYYGIHNGQEFPFDPVVKTLPSNPGGASSIPGQGVRIPHALQPKQNKAKNRGNIIMNSIKTLKMVHIKKKKKEYMIGEEDCAEPRCGRDSKRSCLLAHDSSTISPCLVIYLTADLCLVFPMF